MRLRISDEKPPSLLPSGPATSQTGTSAATRSIPVPGRTARASSAVIRSAPSSKSAATDVQSVQCPPGGAGSSSAALSSTRCKSTTDVQRSRPSGLPCPPTRSQPSTPGSRVTSSTAALAVDSATCNSLPPAKTRALSATSGLVPPGTGSKVSRAPSRSLSRTQASGVRSGRRSAEPEPEIETNRTPQGTMTAFADSLFN